MADSEKKILLLYHYHTFLLMGVVYFLLCTPFIKASFSNSEKCEEEKKSDTQNASYQIGKASYYSNKFNGRKTASGEIYNSNLYTAAHKTLPFGTKVKVTNLKNGKSVIVKINDRGAFKGGRIIDLSRAAAQKLCMIRDGIVKVEIEIVK